MPTALAERVVAALGFHTADIVDFQKFYTEYEGVAPDAPEDGPRLQRVLSTIASGLSWRAAHTAAMCGLTLPQIHEWLDVLGGDSLTACIRADLIGDGELAGILVSRQVPDSSVLAVMGGLARARS